MGKASLALLSGNLKLVEGKAAQLVEVSFMISIFILQKITVIAGYLENISLWFTNAQQKNVHLLNILLCFTCGDLARAGGRCCHPRPDS